MQNKIALFCNVRQMLDRNAEIQGLSTESQHVMEKILAILVKFLLVWRATILKHDLEKTISEQHNFFKSKG